MTTNDEDLKAAEEWSQNRFGHVAIRSHGGEPRPHPCIDAFLAGVAHARRWIPVTERLPEKGREVVFRDDKGCIRTGNLYEESLEEFAFGDGCECCSAFNTQKITHWMPLPPEPKEGE